MGGPKGVGYDLGKELAARLGVPFEPVVFSRNAEVLEAVKTGKADIALTNATPARAKEMDFGPPVFEVELGYLVPKGSALATLADVDATGIRVGVTTGSSSDATLSRDLKNAEIVRATNFDAAIEILSAGSLDAYATNKPRYSRCRKNCRAQKCSMAAGASSVLRSASPKDATAEWRSSGGLPKR
jgi:polar amino acid transport system substrate-binding protein